MNPLDVYTNKSTATLFAGIHRERFLSITDLYTGYDDCIVPSLDVMSVGARVDNMRRSGFSMRSVYDYLQEFGDAAPPGSWTLALVAAQEQRPLEDALRKAEDIAADVHMLMESVGPATGLIEAMYPAFGEKEVALSIAR